MLFLFLRMHAIRSLTCSRSMSRSWYCCRANCGRSISRECFQAAPSCVKIPSPSKGKNIWRRSPYPKSISQSTRPRPIEPYKSAFTYHQSEMRTWLRGSLDQLFQMQVFQGISAPRYCRRLESGIGTAPLSDCFYRPRKFVAIGRCPTAIHCGVSEQEDIHGSDQMLHLTSKCQSCP